MTAHKRYVAAAKRLITLIEEAIVVPKAARVEMKPLRSALAELGAASKAYPQE